MAANQYRPFIPLEDGWNDLKQAIDKLEEMLDGEMRVCKFANNEYIEIYKTCYDMCTQRDPHNWCRELYKRHGKSIEHYLTSTVLTTLRQKAGQGGNILLAELLMRWSNHQIMNKWLKNFFVYLERYYVPFYSLPTLSQVGFRCFRTRVYDEIKNAATEAILSLINSEREGEVIDKSLVKNIVELFERMGMGSLDSYAADLEEPLLASTREYYAKRRQEWIATDSTPDYLIKAETALIQERKRVAEYLNQSTESKLVKVVEEEILEKVETVLLENEGSGCRALLVNDKSEDIERMFSLFLSVEKGLKRMISIVKSFLSGIGMDVINRRHARLEGGEKDIPDDPKFVESLIDFHEKYLEFANNFLGSALFQQGLKDAFVQVVNTDKGLHTNAEIMSTYCDRVLKRGGEKLSESEVEESLEKIVLLFSYLSDKDLFADIYCNHLAKRLLNQRSASHDAEKAMIAKLKMQCGTQFTSKMEGMLADLAVGIEQRNEFSKVRDDQTKLEFSVQVLTSGCWPTYKSSEVALTSEMSKCMDLFCDWHGNRHPKRKLTWLFSLGNATVCATFGKKAYDLQVTTLQAVALNAFNEGKTFTFTELTDLLNLDESIMKPLMHSLSCGKYKVITKIPTSNKINNTDSFTANAKFSSNMRKIRIPMASLNASHNTKRVEEERLIAIEAAVVRIMKARKTLQHQQLIVEVLSQLAFFKPHSRVITNRIEALIEREYLERSADNAQVYNYLA